MTFPNLATPFYTLGRHITPSATCTRPKLQMQNMPFSVFFGWTVSRLVLVEIYAYVYI